MLSRYFSFSNRKSPSLVRNITTFPFLEFKKANAPTVVLLAGFPDDILSGWNSIFLEKLKQKYRVIACCLPDYNSKCETIPWGRDFSSLVGDLHATLAPLVQDQQFYLVAHDWGSVVAQLYENRHSESIKKLVLLDVGRGLDATVKGKVISIIYQVAYAWSYVLFKLLGATAGNIFFGLFNVLTPRALLPVPVDKVTRPHKEIQVHLCYPYYYMWKGILSGNPIRIRYPSVPVLFIYGEQKNCMFHNPQFLSQLDSKSGSKFVALPNSGHWVTHFEPDICFTEISTFCTNDLIR